jgi:16S rRNA (guanine966-N2)-methyltransferase
MRIIAGSKKGMRLISPKTDASRPVIDRVKESVFDVLYKYNMPEGKIVADLFCGVGSFGLEALSRGAKFVTFVERDPKIAAVLKKNIAKADFANQSKVVIADVFRVGALPVVQESKYDLVFVDPPYRLTEDVSEKSPLARLMDALSGQTKAQSLILVRTHIKTELMGEYGIFKMIERRRWGTMVVAFLGRS